MLFAAGSLRLSLHTPDYGIYGTDEMADLNYCTGGTVQPGQLAVELGNTTQLPCQFRDQFFAAYPTVENNALFLSTRVSKYTQHITEECNPNTREQVSCAEWLPHHPKKETFYIAQIENFTLMIDHSFSAPQAGYHSSATDAAVTAGWIEDNDPDSNEHYAPCDDYTVDGHECPFYIHMGTPRDLTAPGPGCRDTTGCRDIVPIQTLLRAAGITNLDTQGDYVDPPTGLLLPYRYSGLILEVDILYTNIAPFGWEDGGSSFQWNLDTSEFSYHYQVSSLCLSVSLSLCLSVSVSPSLCLSPLSRRSLCVRARVCLTACVGRSRTFARLSTRRTSHTRRRTFGTPKPMPPNGSSSIATASASCLTWAGEWAALTSTSW